MIRFSVKKPYLTVVAVIIVLVIVAVSTVSYTHLDVYKRQIIYFVISEI